jgi:thiaminase (transcriptional activator TenA)
MDTENDEKLHDILWKQNVHLANKCLEHPFLQGIKDGTLNEDAFKVYIAQDAFFLKAFHKAYALAIAKCNDTETARIFLNLMAGVLEELNLHKEYSKKLGIEIENVKPMPACRAYTDFLLRIAYQNGIDEIVAAVAPCMILYAFIGKELSEDHNKESKYLSWIKTYSDNDMQSLARQMEELLDAVGKNSEKVRGAYSYAMECELNFFDAPLKKER